MAFFKEELKTIRAFAFDIDGVMARSEVMLHPDGDLMRTMNTKDGYAIQQAIKKGYPIAIISGAKSESIRKRFEALGTSDVFLDSYDKWDKMQVFLERYGLESGDVLFMGDDLPDLEVMSKVGMPVCPNDAVSEIQQVSKYISTYAGGQGCVRDVIEQVLRARSDW